MAAIKKFFERKKADAKFKLAGPGHKLAAPAKSQDDCSRKETKVAERVQPSQSAQMAGVAALQRVQQQQNAAPSMANRSLNVIRAEARKEIELEQQMKSQPKCKEVVADSPPVLAVNGVYFRCPLVGPDILPKAEMEAKIKEFLYEQLKEEPGLTSCLIIHTCNKDKEKVRGCIETLCKCLNNIIENPDEEKFRKIRVNTKTFQEKLLPVEGALTFLVAAGFDKHSLPHGDGGEEEFYVFSDEKSKNMEELIALRDGLISAEPIRPELDRNVRVIAPTEILRTELPAEFYNLTVEDIKREQILKSEDVEKNLMLRTKAMRERDAVRDLRRYRFCLIRIKFPNNILLQGTFKTWEKLSDLKEFIREHLEHDMPFVLSLATGQQLVSDDSTLAELGLAPAVVINFAWDSSLDIPTSLTTYLKSDTLELCSDV